MEYKTAWQLLREAERKQYAPAVEGTAGQALVKASTVRPMWGNISQQKDGAERLLVNGTAYKLRGFQSGGAADSESIVFSPNGIFIGENKAELYIGDKRVKKIYGGLTLLYAVSEASYIFKDGYVNSIEWKDDKFTRPKETYYGSASVAEVATNHYMWINIDNGSSGGYVHNSHVATVNTITVPQKAQYMYVSCNLDERAAASMIMTFGVIPANAATSYSTDNGGQLKDIEVTAKTEHTYKMELADGIKGASLHAIVNAKRPANATWTRLYIHKVWFE